MANNNSAEPDPSPAWYSGHMNTHIDAELQRGFRLSKDDWEETKLDIERCAFEIKGDKNYKGNKGSLVSQDTKKLVETVPSLRLAPENWTKSVAAHLMTSAISRVKRRQSSSNSPSRSPSAARNTQDLEGDNASTDQLNNSAQKPPAQDTQLPAQDTQPPAQDTQPPAQDTQLPAQDTQPPAQDTQSTPISIKAMWISIKNASLPPDREAIDLNNLLNEKGHVSQEKLDAYLGDRTFTLETVGGLQRDLRPGHGAAALTNTCREYAAAGKLAVVIVEKTSNAKEVQLPNATL